MTKILAFTSPAKGHMYPIVPVLAELVSRGHNITIVTLPGSDKALRPLGINVRDLPPPLADDTLNDWQAKSKTAALRAMVRALSERIPAEIEAIRRVVAVERPEALLLDITTPGAHIFAAASGLPWAAWAPMLLPIPSRGIPPYGLGLQPRPGPLGRVRDNSLQWVLNRMWDEVLPDVNHMRTYYGLEPLAHTVDYLSQPPLLLNFTAPPLDDVHTDWPASVRQIGPSLWAPDAEPPAWLAEVDRPIALVTCSTEFQDDGHLAQVAMDALADSGMYTVVTSGAIDPGSFTVPPNARVEAFLPHHVLLDRTAVVVSHGGMGITQKALAAGVPVCVVPFGRDQPEVARRVVSNAAGTWLPKPKLTIARLRASVQEAMNCRDGAARVAAGFAAAGGTMRGADLLEQHFADTDQRSDGVGAETRAAAKPRPSNSVPPVISPSRAEPMVGSDIDETASTAGRHRQRPTDDNGPQQYGEAW